MTKEAASNTWLDRACASVGMTFAEARELWIAVRCGNDAAKLRLNQLLRDQPSLGPVFEHLKDETRRIRRDRGLKPPKTFGRPERSTKGAFARMESKRVKGVSTILQGGLPSLGKSK